VTRVLDPSQPGEVKAFLERLLERLVSGLEGADKERRFLKDPWSRAEGEASSGQGLTCILEGGAVFERAGVAFSSVFGRSLPPSATQQNPALAGKAYRAMGVSLVAHPQNPHAPTAHLNVRFFSTEDGTAWWFGGGFDLTPVYLYDEDLAHWRDTARRAMSMLSLMGVASFERACDEYFTLRHRGERRGIGGLFFDDLNESHPFGGSFAHCFSVARAVGEGFSGAYLPLVQRRKSMPFTEAQKRWQQWRRGRYVEFNLVWDRGTLFGLQSGGRADSILLSMPPIARWSYGPPPGLGREEQRLLDALKVPPARR
jgi:coproporphyrinogen III oxidase